MIANVTLLISFQTQALNILHCHQSGWSSIVLNNRNYHIGVFLFYFILKKKNLG